MMILKYLFNLCYSFELMDIRVIQSSTREKVSIMVAEGEKEKSSLLSINLPQTFLSVFAPVPGLANLCSRETNSVCKRAPHCCTTQKAANPEEVFLEPPCAF